MSCCKSLLTMDSLIEKSFGTNLRIMKLLLLYQPDNQTLFYKIRVYICYLLISTPIPVLGTFYFLLEKNINMDHLADNAFVLSQATFCFFKWLPFVLNNSRIKQCIYFLESERFTHQNNKEKIIFEESIKTCKKNSRRYLIFLIEGFTVWAIRPLLEKHRRFTIDVWLPFDPYADTIIFYLVYICIVSEIFYLAMATAVIDPLIGGLACLAIGQLRVLKDNMQLLDEHAKTEMNIICDMSPRESATINRIIYKNIKKCARHHNSILQFINLYEDTFSPVIFSQFMGSSFQICTCLLQLSGIDPLSFNFFSICSAICVMFLQIYFYCYYGTMLFEESITLTDAIYTGRWYEYDLKSKKMLLIFMERAKSPVIVTAGKILDLSLNTFTMILRRSYSLLAVLRNYV